MKNSDIIMNQNELVQFLKKPSQDFTREDIIRFIEARGIAMLNLRYVADNAKLKSLNFVPFKRERLESILTAAGSFIILNYIALRLISRLLI